MAFLTLRLPFFDTAKSRFDTSLACFCFSVVPSALIIVSCCCAGAVPLPVVCRPFGTNSETQGGPVSGLPLLMALVGSFRPFFSLFWKKSGLILQKTAFLFQKRQTANGAKKAFFCLRAKMRSPVSLPFSLRKSLFVAEMVCFPSFWRFLGFFERLFFRRKQAKQPFQALSSAVWACCELCIRSWIVIYYANMPNSDFAFCI